MLQSKIKGEDKQGKFGSVERTLRLQGNLLMKFLNALYNLYSLLSTVYISKMGSEKFGSAKVCLEILGIEGRLKFEHKF